MAEEAEDEYFNLFDEPEPHIAGIPIAPPLLGADGQPFVIPADLARSLVRGEDAPIKMPPRPLEGDDALPGCRFPVPLLRRDPSLSKNTPSALQSRLAELSALALAAEQRHRLRLLELDSLRRAAELQFAEEQRRTAQEQCAVEEALRRVEQQRKEREEQRRRQAQEQAACARSGAAGSPVTKGGPSAFPLLVDRSPGECSVSGEECGCGVCLERARDALLAPCGHVALCLPCAEGIRDSRNPECPFCRQKVTAVYKLFVV